MSSRYGGNGSGLQTGELMSFLLGELDDSETTRIEEMFLNEDDREEKLKTAEAELFNKYTSGQLDEQQTVVFERRFLQAARTVEELLAKDRANQNVVQRGPTPRELAEANAKGPLSRFWSWLRRLFSR